MWEREEEMYVYYTLSFGFGLTHKRVDKNIIIPLNLFVIRFAFDEHGCALRVRCDNKYTLREKIIQSADIESAKYKYYKYTN